LLDNSGVLLAGIPLEEGRIGQIVGNPAALSGLQTFSEDRATETSEASNQGRRLVAYRKVPEFPLVISAAANEDEALVPWRRIMHPIASGVVAVAFFVLMASILLVKNLLHKSSLESALKEADDQLRHTVQAAKDAIVTANSEKRIVLFNCAAEQMFGLRAAAAIGSEVETLLRGALRQSDLTQVSEFLKAAWESPIHWVCSVS
jgi:PAS domain-containing protein